VCRAKHNSPAAFLFSNFSPSIRSPITPDIRNRTYMCIQRAYKFPLFILHWHTISHCHNGLLVLINSGSCVLWEFLTFFPTYLPPYLSVSFVLAEIEVDAIMHGFRINWMVFFQFEWPIRGNSFICQ
jgi:hypothetical protein